MPCTTALYLWYSQSQGDASQQEQVAVDPVHQRVDAALSVNVVSSVSVLHFLHTLSTHGVDHLLFGCKCKSVLTAKTIYQTQHAGVVSDARKTTLSLVMMQHEKGTEQRSVLGFSLLQLKYMFWDQSV